MIVIINLLNELKLVENQEQKYQILIELSRQKLDFPIEQKIKANLIPNCTVRIWRYKNLTWSDSRLINALLVIMENHDYDSIKNCLDYYNISDFYSTLRTETLSLLFGT